MVSYRLITFLFILSNAGVVSSKSTAFDNQEQVPCSNDEKTSTAPAPATVSALNKSTTTTATVPTTTARPCRKHLGATTYKRQNGWWCSQAFYLDVRSTTPMDLEEGLAHCKLNGFPYISSLETDKERKDYAAIIPEYKVEAWWVNISMNQTNGQYYWSDGYSTPTINPQPKVIDPKGAGVFTLSRDPSVPGHGTLSIVPVTGETTPFVRGVICGAPGGF
ncbi:unnamed protein product [Caenorhabditis brenneri]